MKKYLIDTNTCIYYIKGKFDLKKKFEKADPDNCFISEITLAELKFGVENSEKKEKNQKALDNFLTGVKIVPIFHSLDLYAKEKARLRKSGTPIDEFDGAGADREGSVKTGSCLPELTVCMNSSVCKKHQAVN